MECRNTCKFHLFLIPANSINKIPKVKWTGWQDEPIPQELHEQWKKENMFQEGMAVICGKSWRGEYKDLWLNMVDMDNKLAVKEFCLVDIRKFAQNTLTEQHANKDKAHAYYFTEKPIQSKPPGNFDDDKPAIEVKSQGRFLSYCTPSPHKDGSRYEIIDTTTPKKVDAASLEIQINDICKKHKIHYHDKLNDYQRPEEFSNTAFQNFRSSLSSNSIFHFFEYDEYFFLNSFFSIISTDLM